MKHLTGAELLVATPPEGTRTRSITVAWVALAEEGISEVFRLQREAIDPL